MMFMVMPVIGSRMVSPRLRLVLAFLTTLLVVPLLPALPQVPALSLTSLVYIAQELAIALLVGFTMQIVFQVFVLSGQFMAMKMGLGFASMNDPTNGVQTTALSQFFLLLTTLIFVSVNGHILLLELLVRSFNSLPPGEWQLNINLFYEIALMGSWLFSAALVFALPVLTSLLFVNIAFGIMSRAAPQLNIFAVGFPFTLIVGLILVWLSLTSFLPTFESIMEHGFTVAAGMLGLE
ncbi:hypothetical protein TDB9533_02049 [Thalassocella blandensis]|nr:hypothetical protein TDB9533_02049 [Thalassocella blandensis]